MNTWTWAAIAFGGYLLLTAGILLMLRNATDWDQAPDESEPDRRRRRGGDDTAAADQCPQCHRENSEPWGLCEACSTGDRYARRRNR